MTFFQFFITAVAAYCAGYFIGWERGRRRGEDEQRVADILDQWRGGWRKLPKRDERTGKFTT